jgi:hypothetical protein
VKRSSHVHLTIVGTLGLALAPIISACHGSGTEPRHCIDQNQQVVGEQYCRNVGGGTGGGYPYYWYYGGHTFHSSSGTGIRGGSTISSVSSRGGFGSTAHAASGGHAGAAGAGS